MAPTDFMKAEKVSFLSPEEVLRRSPLLRRVTRDVVERFEEKRRKQERLEELVVISRKFSSVEIHETINSLRNQIAECKRDLESYNREIQILGGTIRDPRRGLVYFNSRRDSRTILLVWDLQQPESVSWHEVDESFADRTPIAFSKGAATSALEIPES